MILAILLLFLAIWIVVPAPVYPLLALGVTMPEVSPVLAILAALLAAVVWWRGSTRRGVVLVLAAVTFVLGILPSAQFIAARTRFNTATSSLPSPTTGRENDSVEVTRGIAFAEPGGRALTIDLYRSEANVLLPIVIQIYGGAWREGAPSNHSAFATALARRGYLVAAIDYRHAPESRWPAQIDDVRAAVQWVIEHAGDYRGDPRVMAMIGRSSGAQLALVEAYRDPARFAGVISLYGPTDLAEGWRTPPTPDPLPVRPVLEAFLGGTPDSIPGRYAAASPITYVSKRVPPTLLIYGARDHIVDSRFGRELHDKLHAVGASSIYLELPWAEHAFDLVPGLSARVVQPYIERFLAAHLQPG